jgi:surface polysaccharide O-acyltransferase-like enzyme
MVYGIQRKSSSSLWMLSGVADFLIGFLCLPVFLIAHGILYSRLGSRNLSGFPLGIRSLGYALPIFWICIVVVWKLNGGHEVWRAN